MIWKKKPKVDNIFWYDSKLWQNFQNETQNLANFTHFEKFIFIQQWLTQNMWSIGATICIFNKKLQNISFKNSFIWKNEKRLIIFL
jgi:hypothetical protein